MSKLLTQDVVLVKMKLLRNISKRNSHPDPGAKDHGAFAQTFGQCAKLRSSL
jgi:hypothetical protein